MTILHYIQSMALSTGIAPEYVNSLVHSTMQVSTSHIITEKDINTSFFAFRKNFLHQLELINPDIVHIHGAWSAHTAWIEQLARSKGYFTVISPHGELSPTKMEQRFWRDRFPRILLYQLRMIRKSNMLVVTTREELEDMKRLNWKRNIALIPHPVLNGLSDDEMSELLSSAYRKVIDTNYRQRITSEEELMLNTCLMASVWPDDKELPDNIQPVDTTGISFRRIYLYAHDDNVTDAFIKGAHRLGIEIPTPLDVDSIPRFKHTIKFSKMESRQFRRFAKILAEQLPEECKSIITSLQDIANAAIKRVTLKELLIVYQALRHCDYDEDMFNRSIKKNLLKRFYKRLMAKLQETFNLEEGYMPHALK